MKLSDTTYQVTIGVLVLIILALGWLLYRGNVGVGMNGATVSTTKASQGGIFTGSQPGGQGSSTLPPSTGSTTSTSSGAGDSVSVAGQSAGTSVSVASVTLSQPGWVAVRDSSGRTLGAAWFDTGTHSDVTVPLLRSTEAGQSYQVLLYADNGDHQFDLHTDALISGADGSVPGTTFSAQ